MGYTNCVYTYVKELQRGTCHESCSQIQVCFGSLNTFRVFLSEQEINLMMESAVVGGNCETKLNMVQSQKAVMYLVHIT